MGNQYPRSGTCYAGLFAYSHGSYREYIQTPLKVALKKNKFYKFKMYISFADYSRTAIDQLGVCFLTYKASYNSTGTIMDLKPVYLEIESKFRKDTVGWQCLTTIYRASGDETYLLIGSFKINDIQKTKVKAPKTARTRINQSSERDAYYYIDDVSLVEMTDTPLYDQMDSILEIKRDTAVSLSSGTPLILKNISFKTNEAILSVESFSVLDKFAAYLNANPDVMIEIAGHTDNVGRMSKNQKLSERRAKAVCDYLVTKGVDLLRITHKGYGSSSPITTNATEEGRSENRRVEFILKNK